MVSAALRAGVDVDARDCRRGADGGAKLSLGDGQSMGCALTEQMARLTGTTLALYARGQLLRSLVAATRRLGEAVTLALQWREPARP